MIKRSDLQESEYNLHYATYINQVPEDSSLLDALEKGQKFTIEFFSSLSPEQQEVRYAKGKWTPKEVLLHLIDTERIFSYRALRIGRMDTSPLVGFEQDDYVLHSNATRRSMESLITEYNSVRAATMSLFQSMNDHSLSARGEASGNLLSPRAAAFITAGHERHHIRIIKERYL